MLEATNAEDIINKYLQTAGYLSSEIQITAVSPEDLRDKVMITAEEGHTVYTVSNAEIRYELADGTSGTLSYSGELNTLTYSDSGTNYTKRSSHNVMVNGEAIKDIEVLQSISRDNGLSIIEASLGAVALNADELNRITFPFF